WQDVTGSPYTLQLERKAGVWAVLKPADFKLDEGKIDGLLSYLATLRAKRFVAHKGSAKQPDPKETKLDLKAGALLVEITLEGEKEPITLTIGGLKTDKMAEGYYAQSNKLPGDTFLLAEDEHIKNAKSKPAWFKKE